jgi:hypothetical protein
MKLIITILILGTLVGCISKNDESEIYGSWERTGSYKETLTFLENGTVAEMPNTRFEIITTISPKQIYLIREDQNGESIRMPMGIYKITGDKLVLANAKFYEKTLSGIPLGGISKVEMPKDFSSSSDVYEFKRAETPNLKNLSSSSDIDKLKSTEIPDEKDFINSK